MIDALHTVGHEFVDLVRRDGAATAAEHADVPGAVLPEPVDHVAEVLDVPALVGTHGDAVGVLLDRGAHDLVHAAVVAEMHHLDAMGLDQPPHDVDRGVVAVEQRSRGDEAQRPAGIDRRGAPVHRG